MAPLLSYHPFKALFTILTLTTVPPYLVLLSILYQIPQLRPHPEWTFRTAIANKLMQIFYKYATFVRLKPLVHMTPPKSVGDRYVMVQPGPERIYTGVLKSNESIKPASMPAIWCPRKYDTSKDGMEGTERKVVIHFQGGAFVHAGDPLQAADFPAGLYEKHLNALTFYAQYRLSRDNETRFPAALQDAVTFYRYVLDLGVKPENVIVGGDSAGGNLVLALARYIEDNAGVLPRPRGIMAWSPWVDMRVATLEEYKKNPLRHTDFVSAPLGFWGMEAYVPKGEGGMTKDVEKYISPIVEPFRVGMKLFVQVGTSELFFDAVGRFAKKLKDVNSGDGKVGMVKYWETKNMSHDLILAGGILGFAREAEDAVKAAGEFFNGEEK